MTIDGLKQWHEARPFKPFIMRLTNGRRLRVHHPEFLARSPSCRTAVLYGPRGSFETIELREVTTISLVEGKRNNRRSTGGTSR